MAVPFDLVAAAEKLLAQAKMLAAVRDSSEVANEEALRRSIAETARKIALETAPPLDIVKSDWFVLADVAAWNIFIDWKAFDHIPLEGHISIADLARALDAQESLVARISAQLLSTGKLLPGPTPHTLRHSRISPLFRTAHPVSALAAVAVGNGMKPCAHWPAYFAAHGRREPPGLAPTPFAFAWGRPDLPPWEVKALHPAYAALFTRCMRAREIVAGDTAVVGPRAVYDFSWVGVQAQAQAQGVQQGPAPVVVDVGGGLGQLLRDLLRDVRGLQPGQCVLQDRREVIEEAREVARRDGRLEGVRMMEHDFHEEQPVKGALVYILRRILLDYPDQLAVGILRRLAEALPADNPKARVLVIEARRLDVPTPENCNVDLFMLNLGGKLRDEAMLKDLAAAAGLSVMGYHASAREGDPTFVMECARA
ncbi:99dfc218-e9b4-4e38-8bcb-293d008bcab3 [Thermothielavioides terrestris]|uniref:99dfc218-e9b4-4e38-8bcb-293d008bcab3 n=1 Tax=Thermothielavioides terrestris TaxID=2587410 RepID=A0A446BTB2_9PEZI|nr:99dfc218-e9b4-4e38-8bcb-293d008bcab3 [Thermothielavioides terrestris]